MHFARNSSRLAGQLCRGLIAASLLLVMQVDVAGAAPTAQKSKKRPHARQQELYGISWYESVDGALKGAAAESPKKPVFWLRMLGDLDGYS